MLPGKTYTPDDYIRIVWTRKWFIIVPALVAGIGAFVWSSSLPNLYQSSTIVRVVPQQVPQNFVQPTVTASVSERLQTISQEILSRTRLEQIIATFNLYAEERERMIMEDVVERMRRDISVNVAPARRNQDSSSFTVSFQSTQPRVALAVTEQLASLFVQENLEAREDSADITHQFLQASLADTKRRLVEHEAKLQEFRDRHQGRLPSQVNQNLQMYQTTQTQLQANAEAANRERDRLFQIESELAALESAPAAAPGDPLPAVAGPIAQQLDAARVNLQQLELVKTPDHPDIRYAKRVIAELEVKAEEERRAAAEGRTIGGGKSPATLRAEGLRQEAKDLRGRLEDRAEAEKRLQERLTLYGSRVSAAPGLEAEETELMRDYGAIQEQYSTLLRQAEDSRIALTLEQRAIGEQFRIVEGARLPERPVSPDRLRINVMGLLGGLGFGVALVALLEYRDTTLKTDQDVLVSLALPVLAVIPSMTNDVDRQRTKRRRLWLAVSGSVATAAVAGAAVVWKLGLLETWSR